MRYTPPGGALWLGSLALAGLFLVGAVAAFAAFGPAARPRTRRRAGSVLLPVFFIDFFEWLVDPLVDGLARLKIHPNHITVATVLFAGITGAALGAGYLAVGWWLLVLTGAGDTLDGRLARRTRRSSRSGAFLDSFADRLSDAFFLAGLAYYGGGTLLSSLCIWALVASLAVSYARARGESLDVDCAVGLMQRPERITLLSVTLFAALLVPIWVAPEAAARSVRGVLAAGIGTLAVLSSVTAINRARWIVGRLRAEEDTSATSVPNDARRETNK